jgi:hypothetical protein
VERRTPELRTQTSLAAGQEGSAQRFSCALSAAPRLTEIQLAGRMKLSKWRRIVGISRTAAWRLRKSGKLPVVVRYGQAYVTAETIANFFKNDGSNTRSFQTKD